MFRSPSSVVHVFKKIPNNRKMPSMPKASSDTQRQRGVGGRPVGNSSTISRIGKMNQTQLVLISQSENKPMGERDGGAAASPTNGAVSSGDMENAITGNISNQPITFWGWREIINAPTAVSVIGNSASQITPFASQYKSCCPNPMDAST